MQLISIQVKTETFILSKLVKAIEHFFIDIYLKNSLEWRIGLYAQLEIYVAIGTSKILSEICSNKHFYCIDTFCGYSIFLAVITITFYTFTQIIIIGDIYGFWKKVKVLQEYFLNSSI